jgi:hypothetical protein
MTHSHGTYSASYLKYMKLFVAAFLILASSCASTPKGPTLEEQYMEAQQSLDNHVDTLYIKEGAPLVGPDSWVSTYKYADLPGYYAHCKKVPSYCKDKTANEFALRINHNNSVVVWHKQTRANLEAQYHQIKQQQLDALQKSAAMQNALYYQMQQQPAFAPAQNKPADMACMQRCQASGSQLQYCQSKCSF